MMKVKKIEIGSFFDEDYKVPKIDEIIEKSLIN